MSRSMKLQGVFIAVSCTRVQDSFGLRAKERPLDLFLRVRGTQP